MFLVIFISFLQFWGDQDKRPLIEYSNCADKSCLESSVIQLNADSSVVFRISSDQGARFMQTYEGRWKRQGDSLIAIYKEEIMTEYVEKTAFDLKFLIPIDKKDDWPEIESRIAIAIEKDVDIKSIELSYGIESKRKAIKKMMELLLARDSGKEPSGIFVEKEIRKKR